MEIRAFYGEFGLRKFEARNYKNVYGEVGLRQIVNMENIWRFGLSFFFNMEFQDHFRASGFSSAYLQCGVFFYIMH